ncbi:hypothetical protein HYH03_006823 [Edaphochlamys debaryana]|uniref:HIT domain-containing protein n=1 Tax=Edaphochlamys debaryana TaxID=47281 RepID=A0A835Y4W7_9CHLO|nr:hypothetical protein HYH03_006823 [Edaphochlamys debaryana]|eukprot:KAG2495217.1 hypothetical protein HYH03_006823 [Edaphochlamys debaryana]
MEADPPLAGAYDDPPESPQTSGSGGSGGAPGSDPGAEAGAGATGGGGGAVGAGGGAAGAGPGGRGRQRKPPHYAANGQPPLQGPWPVLLLLAGLPGSGKSTLSRRLLAASPVAWAHVNQDAVNDGKPGKREQCLAAAKSLLGQGCCVIIDRCHADPEQRSSFLGAASEAGVEAHCVALGLPPDACARRVGERTEHPGGVKGAGWRHVVFQMAKRQQAPGAWPPSVGEGFASVMDCLSDADADVAVKAWALYGSAGGGGGGGDGSAAAATLAAWQAHVAKRKPTGIAAFFKPAATGSATAAAAGGGGAAVRKVSGAAAAATTTAAAKAGKGPAGTAKAAGGGPAAAAASASPKAAAGRRPGEAGPEGEPPAKRQATGGPSKGPGGSGAAATAGDGSATPPASAAAKPGASQPSPAGGAAGGANAFAVLMASSRKGAATGAGGSGAGGGAKAAAGATGGKDAAASGAAAGAARDPRFNLTAGWAQPLRQCALNPDTCPQTVLHKDDQVVMIADAYPKARHHALVLARDPALRSIADLRPEHLPLLTHMREVAEDWVRKQKAQDPEAVAFKLGFHAVPSMAQLHLHVVSQDFDSPALKNKKHWNTFTTEFFLPFAAVEAQVRERGQLALISAAEEKRLEGLDLRCHGCGQPLRTIPDLKKHIVACESVKRLPGL